MKGIDASNNRCASPRICCTSAEARSNRFCAAASAVASAGGSCWNCASAFAETVRRMMPQTTIALTCRGSRRMDDPPDGTDTSLPMSLALGQDPIDRRGGIVENPVKMGGILFGERELRRRWIGRRIGHVALLDEQKTCAGVSQVAQPHVTVWAGHGQTRDLRDDVLARQRMIDRRQVVN